MAFRDKDDASHGPTRDSRDAALESFVQELTAAQASLRAYITASLGRASDVPDVLQRANLALWKNAENYQAGTNFLAWAITIARYEILAYCRDKSRDRHVFPENIAALMLDIALDARPEPSDRQEALQHCLGKLPKQHYAMLRRRYFDGQSTTEIAASMKRTENAVKCALVRVRKTLQSCIETRLGSAVR
ncbi:MAG: RNA polymerase subunit sigma-70 [Planctomycetaceae bacterium]|nr:RNA polymerase subunit sigma-70 [Planctomycetaceae bacterium]